MSEGTQSNEQPQTRLLTMNDQLPGLYIPYPRCGNCLEDVTIEDGCAWCEGCLIQWNRIDEDCPATPDEGREGSDVACRLVAGKQDGPHDDKHGNHYIPGPPKPCILPSGHMGEHLCPYDVEFSSRPGDRT